MKEILAGKTLDELRTLAAELEMPRYAASQIAKWLYGQRVADIESMTNLSKAHRSLLARRCEVGYYAHRQCQKSVDGTVKYLFDVGETAGVEAVYIPDKERATLCVSSQVGCKMNCYFCMTGKQGFARNLTTHEIVNQIISVPLSRNLTNLVFMGMGEPLDNIDNLMRAIEVLTQPWGLGWSPHRITISTIGYMPGLRRFLDECNCHLAVSLHAPTAGLRSELMPVERAFPMQDLLALLSQYDWSRQRHLTFEYIVFAGYNDTMAHADTLARLLRPLPCRVNLIRFHAIPGVELHTAPMTTMEQFRDRLNSRGITATIRASRGEDIYAACGMLSTAEKRSDCM